MTTSPSGQPVLVIGISGFVGGRLAAAFLADGRPVRGLARDTTKVTLPAAPGLDVVQGDMLDPQTLELAVSGVAAVYVCVHTLSRQRSGAAGDYMALEQTGLRNIVSACQAKAVRRVIYVTSIGVDPDAPSSWLRERWKAEQYLLGSGLDVTVFRPGMIVGVGGQGFNNVLTGARRRVATALGDGGNKMRPMAVTDLTHYMVAVQNESQSFGQVYEVGSDDVLTMDQMINVAAECLGRAHPRTLHLPRRAIRAAAPLLERVSKMPRGSLAGALDSMQVDLIGDPSAIRQLITGPLRSYRQAVNDELANQKS